ncbi:hypothetical protein D1872_283550 [compost metagenome]
MVLILRVERDFTVNVAVRLVLVMEFPRHDDVLVDREIAQSGDDPGSLLTYRVNERIRIIYDGSGRYRIGLLAGSGLFGGFIRFSRFLLLGAAAGQQCDGDACNQ